MDLSLYKDESQIEKKTSSKRKLNKRNDDAKKSMAKKQKIDVDKSREPPLAKMVINTKTNQFASRSAKVNKCPFNWVEFIIIFYSLNLTNESLTEDPN